MSRHGHADAEPGRRDSEEARQDELDEAYWAQLLDDAYRMQLETVDEESSDETDGTGL